MSQETDPLTWARDYCPILRSFQAEYGDDEPLAGHTVAVATHLEAKSGILIETLHEAGADVLFAPSEPQSTHGDVVDALDAIDGVTAFAWEGMSDEEFDAQQHELLENEPDFILDDGCELISKAHADHSDVAVDVIGGGEQTTAGITRVEAMEEEGVLQFPVYTVNDTPMKHFFDNVHGTGESALTNIAITSNTIISGKDVVVAGYGYCGRGIARKARGMGAQTIVTEVDPRKALEAHMDGHRVMSMTEAAAVGDLFITTTGNRDVIRKEHFEAMTNGVQLANAGHFDVEIDVDALESLASDTSTPKEGVTRYHMPDGRDINLLADGRLVNLTGPYSQGHPAEVIDTTHSMMFVAAYDLIVENRDLTPGAYAIPDRLDREVAERKLETLDVTIDEMIESQREYATDWRHEGSSF
ncbi:adenosylhomocysteinase [Halopenitus malekzadehii]|uniref:Adenosylhomocysteinase n=1 Tax=Halopenitus malekzadehii TaxID=1267564 RepID=A0A1H6HX31_9EURY|nr:adenosylhomocysteinase [Halopenitus malekzadehii]SEH40217.1 adenosylhomocysteinase [Halopenitus malekzadehii]